MPPIIGMQAREALLCRDHEIASLTIIYTPGGLPLAWERCLGEEAQDCLGHALEGLHFLLDCAAHAHAL